jgi:lysozyme family protein
MVSHFNEVVPIVLEIEGVDSNNEFDSGGATKYGITEKVARANGWTGDMRDLPLDFALSIYKKHYWDAIGGDAITDKGIAILLFDASVNNGVQSSIKILQQALNYINGNEKRWNSIEEDGIWGKETSDAMSKCMMRNMEHQLFNSIFFTRGKRYLNIIDNNPTQKEFTNGWLNRLMKLAAYSPK